jgi:hypothetical protein
MPRGKRQITATGFYTAIALIVYALIGAITNDLYIPGRRSGGVHLHNEAIPPALLGIFLAALTLPLQHFRKTTWLARTRIALLAGAALSMLLCFYFIAFPSGRRLASVEQCQATFARIEQLWGKGSGSFLFSRVPNGLPWQGCGPAVQPESPRASLGGAGSEPQHRRNPCRKQHKRHDVCLPRRADRSLAGRTGDDAAPERMGSGSFSRATPVGEASR